MMSTGRKLLFLLTVLLLATSLLAAQELEEGTEAETALKNKPAAEADTVLVPVGTHIPLVLQNTVSTKNAAPGDPLYFETIYPVVVNSKILVPVGSFVRGSLTHVKRPGRIKGRAELYVRFDELTLPNGYTVDLNASLATAGARQNEEVAREEGKVKGDSSKGDDAGTVISTTGAGTGIGAGVGAISGNAGKGAGLGAGIGAAAGLATVLMTRGKELELPRGTTVDIVVDRPLELDAALATFDWTGRPSQLGAPEQQQRDRGLRRYPPF
jgi:type IV secretion system protein VirB10